MKTDTDKAYQSARGHAARLLVRLEEIHAAGGLAALEGTPTRPYAVGQLADLLAAVAAAAGQAVAEYRPPVPTVPTDDALGLLRRRLDRLRAGRGPDGR